MDVGKTPKATPVFSGSPPPQEKAEPHPGSKELIAILHRSHWLGTVKIKLEPGSLAARERSKIINLVILPLTVGRGSDGWLEGFEMHTNEETEQHSPLNISKRHPFANNCMQYFLFFGRTLVANLVGECFFGVEGEKTILLLSQLCLRKAILAQNNSLGVRIGSSLESLRCHDQARRLYQYHESIVCGCHWDLYSVAPQSKGCDVGEESRQGRRQLSIRRVCVQRDDRPGKPL